MMDDDSDGDMTPHREITPWAGKGYRLCDTQEYKDLISKKNDAPEDFPSGQGEAMPDIPNGQGPPAVSLDAPEDEDMHETAGECTAVIPDTGAGSSSDGAAAWNTAMIRLAALRDVIASWRLTQSNANLITRIDDLMMAVVLEESQGHISEERLHALQWDFGDVKKINTELERQTNSLVRLKSTVWQIPGSPDSDHSSPPLNGGEDVSMEDVEKYLDHDCDDDATTEPMQNQEDDSQDQKPLVQADTRKAAGKREGKREGGRQKAAGKREGNKGKAKVGNCRLKSKQPDSKAKSKF